MRIYEILQNELMESPQRVPPITFDLENRKTNLDFVKKRISKIVEVIEETEDYKIVRTGSDINGWIFMLDKSRGLAVYVVQYTARNWKWLPKTVTQCIVWRDKYSGLAVNVTSRIFFNYLLVKFPAILSDRLQTEYGNNFWLTRMDEANRRGFKVGIVQMNSHTTDWYDKNSGISLPDWLKNNVTFGYDERFQFLRYIIQNK